VKGSRDLLIEFWDPLHILGTVGVRNFKFGMQIDHRGTNERNAKLFKGAEKGSRDLLLKFWDPLHISGTVGARNFKFGMQTDHQGH